MFAYSWGGGAELGPLEPWHAEQFLEMVDRLRGYLSGTIPVAHTVHTIDDARQYLQRFADGHAKDTEHLFGVWLDGRLVGVTQLVSFNAQLGTCELGVFLDPVAQGRGLITRSCRYLIDWAIGVRGMKRVQWTNNPTNVRSSAVARRLGMTREGLLRTSFGVAGTLWDNEIWSVVASEWPTVAPAPTPRMALEAGHDRR